MLVLVVGLAAQRLRVAAIVALIMVRSLVSYTASKVAVRADHELVLDVIAQVVLNVCEQLAAECIFARLIRQSEMTHLV